MTIPPGGARHFTIGAWRCVALSDGVRAMPWSVVVPDALPEPAARVPDAHGPPAGGRATGSTCLLVIAGERHILVDTGAGPQIPGAGRLIANLRAVGVEPERIDTVVLSHAHPGHIGGALDAAGRPAFPRARHVLWREEWAFWQAGPDLRARGMQWLVESSRVYLGALADRVDLVERDAEILPGITVVAAPGHTAGHLGLALADGDERLLYLADAVFHPRHLEHPGWCSPFDLRPEQSVTSRIRLLDRAVGEEALVLAAHFAFPSLGRARAHGDVWRWEPLPGVGSAHPPSMRDPARGGPD